MRTSIDSFAIDPIGPLGLSALGTAAGVLLAVPAFAFQFESSDGDLSGSFDNTISYGLQWRAQDRDADLIGFANRQFNGGNGNAYSLNGDDGNLNYGNSGNLVSSQIKLISELLVDYKDFSLFVRGRAFYDWENKQGERDRTPLTGRALNKVGSKAEILDRYLSYSFDLADRPGQVRVGEQVVSWGESTFIQNGINVINSIDVAAIRTPGAELREALLPQGLLWGSIDPTDNTTVEAFYQYDWDKIDIDPPGTFFSSNDFAGEGGNMVMLGFGTLPDNGGVGAGTPANTVGGIPRESSDLPGNDGQWGASLKWFLPELNDTQLGFYYMNYHSRLPLISSRTGTQAGVNAGNAIYGTNGLNGTGARTYLNALISQDVQEATDLGVSLGQTEPQASYIAQNGAANGAAGGGINIDQAQTVLGNVLSDAYGKTARYFIDYPKNIQMLGLSFNTQLQSTGTALQGEFSYKKDLPLQIDDIEILFATLGAAGVDYAGGRFVPLATENQVGNTLGLPDSSEIKGYIERDVSQFQMTATQVVPNRLGANQWVFLGEVGVVHVHNMPKKSTLRLDGPGTYISGNAALASFQGPLADDQIEGASHFADATSWGYRLLARAQYNNAIGPVTLFPRVAFAHDVNGNTPRPYGTFLQNRRAMTFGLTADYQNTWTADLSYTTYWGASRYNLINDRDFIGFNVKYAF